MKARLGLDLFDSYPEDMLNYLRNYGYHFSKNAYKFAVSKMKKDYKAIECIDKDSLELLLTKYKIILQNNVLYDAVFVANMCKADFLGSSVPDEEHLALFVKNYIDDEDLAEGFVFCRWYVDMIHQGIPIDWSELL